MRIFLGDYKEKRVRRAFYGVFAGLFVGLIPICIGAGKGLGFIFWLGIAEMFVVGLVCLLYMYHIVKNFVWCDGGVLEVLDGRVVTYHAEPFCYKVKELAGAQLVSVPIDAFGVAQKVFFVVGREIASYELKCLMGVVSWQNFYNAFLRQSGCQTTRTPKEIAELSLGRFLGGYFFLGEMYQGNGDSAEFVCATTRPLVEEHLQRELAVYGLGCSKVNPEFQSATHFIL